jgi:very-short-patch-repair endonuclease
VQRIPPELTDNARRLRREGTPEERAVWQALREHRPRFTRQLVVDRYILDLACRSARIAIEIDGGHHCDQIVQDAERTRYLERAGWTVMRFWNSDVRDNLGGVVETILAAVARGATHPRPLPSREGR